MLATILLTAVIPLPTGADGVGLSQFDCSDPAPASAEKTLKASEFLHLLTGEKIGDAEARYVDSVLEEALAYTDSIPVSKVTVHYDGETVHVAAESYAYTSAGGISVKWIPDRAKLGEAETEMKLSGESGAYEGEIALSAPTDDDTPVYVNVEYTFELSVSGREADTYRNYAYDRAFAISRETEEYELRLAAYNSYVKYQSDMKQYEVALDAYERYLTDKAAYDAELKRYQAYIAARKAYDEQLAAYNEYVKADAIYKQDLIRYQEYLKAKSEYDESKRAYEAYSAIVEKATAKLAVIENAFIANSKYQVLYNTLWGSTVSEVVSRQDELVNVGKCDPQDILNAGDATERLRVLLKGYKEKTSLADKYTYYVQNYEAIKNDFILLYRSLHQLYENEAVYAGIVMNNRLERYVEFLSHLYVIQSCFDDGYKIDESWSVKREYDEGKLAYNYYGYKDVLEACQIPVDTNNSSPDDLKSFPTEVKAPGEEPTPVAAPKQPEAVKDPGHEPDEVDEPTMPEAVNEPRKPQTVEPAEKPEAVNYTAVENGILAAFRSGELKERSESGSTTVKLSSVCTKLVPIGDRYLVTFYDDDARTVLYQYYAGYREVAEYSGETPIKEGTPKYSYSFNGWKTANGDKAVFGEITEYETVYYASYKRTVNQYKIKWIVDGVVTEETYEYGQTPTYKGSTSKANDERYRYNFIGWSAPRDTVTADAVYEALYEATPRKYEITFIIDGVSRTEQYEYGEMPVCNYSTDKAESSTHIYKFKSWDRELTAVSGNATYTAVYESTVIAADGDGETLDVVTDGDRYSVSTDGSQVRADVLTQLGADKKKTVSVSLMSGELSVIFSTKASESFVSRGGTYVRADKKDGVYTVSLLAADMSPVESEVTFTVLFRGEGIDKNTAVYLKNGDGEIKLASSYADGGVSVKLSESAELILKREYSITLNDFENGAITADASTAKKGDTVSFELMIDDEYELTEIAVIGDKSGTKYTLDSENRLIMPDESVTVSVSVGKKTFTVTFVSDGKVVSVKEYLKGEIIQKPADPTKEGDGEKIYQFLEWDPLFVEGAAATADVTYNAVFKELLVDSQKGFIPKEDNRFIGFVLAVVCCLLVVIVAALVVIILLMKKKKKNKAAKSEIKEKKD